jgi:hypothetical protein
MLNLLQSIVLKHPNKLIRPFSTHTCTLSSCIINSKSRYLVTITVELCMSPWRVEWKWKGSGKGAGGEQGGNRQGRGTGKEGEQE